MSQNPQQQANSGYYTSPAWRTPAELDAARWDWLQNQALTVLARALDDAVSRLDRIEAKLDHLVEAQEQRPQRRRVAKSPES